MSDNNSNENILTKKGCKNTKSRKAVVNVLQKAEKPVSAEEIFLLVKGSGESANLSTVYRTLDLMESKGLVEKTMIGDNKTRYRLTGDGHKHHLICTNCHKMIPINVCPLKSIEKDIGMKTKFNITGHKLELYGLCPDCKKD